MRRLTRLTNGFSKKWESLWAAYCLHFGFCKDSVPLFGIDVFEGALEGMLLAEAEFNSAEADALIIPDFILREVTADQRFTGGELFCASWRNVGERLRECGITPCDSLRDPKCA